MATVSTKNFPITFINTAALLKGPENKNSRSLGEQIPNSFSILSLDSLSSPSSFITLNFITKSIKINRPVLFLNFNDSRSHWESLLQKQGIQLNNNKAYQNLFKFINISKVLLSDQTDGKVNENENKRSLNESNHSNFLDELLRLIEREINNGSTSNISGFEPLLVIDDLTTMVWSGFGHSDIYKFLRKLDNLQHQLNFSLLKVFHLDFIDSNGLKRSQTQKISSGKSFDDDQVLLNRLIQGSDLILKTSSLGSQGLGELAIIRGPKLLSINSQIPFTLSSKSILQYRIDDNTVNYYPKGLDKGFI